MKVEIIKRGKRIQMFTKMTVGSEELTASVDFVLKGGTKSNKDAMAAFWDALEKDGDVDECFDAFDDHPEIEGELEKAIEIGKQELLAKVTAELQAIAQQGQNAQQLLDSSAVQFDSTGDVREPSEDRGICRVCFEEFELHYIGNHDDICEEHLDPSYV